jgi:hypothetical protein
MTRPPWEVADVIRRAGDKFLERYRGSLTWTQLKVTSSHRALPHSRTRWASRSMRSLRVSGHLLPLLPKPALSEVPDQSKYGHNDALNFINAFCVKHVTEEC